jgi:ribosomal protein L11 methyltransferase
MKRNLLWKVSARTSAEAEDAVTELLGAVFGRPVSSYADAESPEVVISVYLERRADWSAPKRQELTAGLERMHALGLNIAPGSVSFRGIPRQDWAESWKLHFKPFEIGSALLLKPSWSRRRPRKRQAAVVLDPGLSFGTGRHPTTSFCLQQLVALRTRVGESPSCLDIGTGSGVLAIAAAKLGYRPIEALDYDPVSIRVARANARRNRVAARIRIRRQDLTRLPRRSRRKHSVICANLVSTLLVAERNRILSRLHPAGTLLVAGILKSEFRQVREALETAGLRLSASRTQAEWRSGAFTWRPRELF